ncbi:hypothetical protein [Bacillus litorisediminis]|uniref:hypothetical protein n=1 Tax=Bacillus litorisediminis TaxID=2922713 RepID=UPI001FAECEC9|nr:hypothetical protein [Bacillus litorisediminis]
MGLVADVFKVLVVASNGDVLATDTLSDAGIVSEVTKNDVVGGASEGLIAVLHGRRDTNITLTDPVWNMENLALHLGQDIVVGAGEAYKMPSWKTVVDNMGTMEITLDEAPLTDSLKLYTDAGTRISAFTVSGTKVTITETGIAAGDKVEVRTYKYTTSAQSETLEIDIAKFPKDAKIILETLEIDEDEQPLATLQYQFDRVKPDANFSINTATAREASNTESAFRVMKPKDSTVVGRLIRIPFEAA